AGGDRVRRRGAGERRPDDTLTAPQAERRERQVERRGAGADRDRVRGADVAREGRLELLHPGSGGEPPRAEHVQDGGNVPVVDLRPKERYALHESPKRSAARNLRRAATRRRPGPGAQPP